jgi:hypothetical protein
MSETSEFLQFDHAVMRCSEAIGFIEICIVWPGAG